MPWEKIDKIKGSDGLNGSPGTNGSPGAAGPPGAAGNAATIAIGNITTGNPGSNATVTNTGTPNAAVLDFSIPKGANGTNGTNGIAASVGVGTVTSLSPGSSPTVTNSGTANAAVLNFGIPTGATGAAGPSALSGSKSEVMPLLALGAAYSFDVPVSGATTSMVPVVNWPVGFLDSLSFWSASIEEANKVKIRLKAGLALAAGTRTFYVRVIQ